MNDEAKALRDKLPEEDRRLFDKFYTNSMPLAAIPEGTYISKAGYDHQYGPEINIYNCTPDTWNALGGNYEKDVKDPFYNPNGKFNDKLPF